MDSTERLVEVVLSGLVYGGSAMGRLPDGRAVFVPYALPGERVRVHLVEEKRGHAMAELIQVIEPSPDRITPRCRHFTTCGGCHYQHMSYARQLSTKDEILRDQLERIGGIQSPPVQPSQPAPQAWFYRNTVQFHLSPSGKLGFLAPDSQHVVPIQECFLPETSLNELWPLLDLEPVPGLNRIGLRLGVEDNAMLILVGSEGQTPEFSVDLPISAVYLDAQGPIILAGDDSLLMEVHGRLFQVSPGSFFQINTLMAGVMVDYLLTHLPLTPEMTLLEVYCGVGLFSAFLAPRVKRLVGIEQSHSACQDFGVNLDEFEHVDLYEGAAEAIIPILPGHADGVVVDPPRSGLDRKTLEAILAGNPDWVAYISCDPATLARDLRRLTAAGYRLQSVTPFDLFPQTYHIESISILSR